MGEGWAPACDSARGGPNRGDNREEHEGRDATSLGNEREALEGVKIGTIE